jgi:two-component system, NarL family, nitrate/nitrite response regulator NarL
MKVGIISPRILIRRALSALLVSTGSAYVVLEANSVLENLEEIKRSHADILIIDTCGSLEDIEDISALPQFGLHHRVLVLMDDLEPESCMRAVRTGAWGCLSTKQSPMVLQKALSTVAEGGRWMPAQAASQIIEGFVEKQGSTQKTQEELTPREWEVLGLLANGSRKKEIANHLSISEETAKSHIKSIYRKLNITPRRNAIFHYFEHVHRSSSEVEAETGIQTKSLTSNKIQEG